MPTLSLFDAPPARVADRPAPPKPPKHNPAHCVPVWRREVRSRATGTVRTVDARRPHWNGRRWRGRWVPVLTAEGNRLVADHLAKYPKPQAVLTVTAGGRKLLVEAGRILGDDEITQLAALAVCDAVRTWVPGAGSNLATHARAWIAKRVREAAFPRRVGELDSPVRNARHFSAIDGDADRAFDPPAAPEADAEAAGRVRDAMAVLSPADRSLIERYYGLDGSGRQQTVEEAGRRSGVGRVLDRLLTALAKMRAALAGDGFPTGPVESEGTQRGLPRRPQDGPGSGVTGVSPGPNGITRHGTGPAGGHGRTAGTWKRVLGRLGWFAPPAREGATDAGRNGVARGHGRVGRCRPRGRRLVVRGVGVGRADLAAGRPRAVARLAATGRAPPTAGRTLPAARGSPVTATGRWCRLVSQHLGFVPP